MASVAAPLEESLRVLLRRGLPAAEGAIADRLLELPGVIARASGRDRASRAAAFNALLYQLIGRLPGGPDSQTAARLLFGDGRRHASRTLTGRRAAAAMALGRDPDHFRKHIELRLLGEVAGALAADSEHMARRPGPPRLAPVATPPPPLPADQFAWEAVEHEEHISRLWAAVYALRAELLAGERLASMDPAGRNELAGTSEAALWRLGQLHVAIRAYRRAYGTRLLNSDLPPESLVSMAGWTPALDPAEAELICRHGPDTMPLDAWLRRLAFDPAGERLRARWASAFVVLQADTFAADHGSPE
ncbi:MAG: hypothetical protein ACRDRJ_19665 [Streptosporangiaceae bacterium]